jgi:hypothetical protein
VDQGGESEEGGPIGLIGSYQPEELFEPLVFPF